MWITTTWWKFLKRWEYQTTLPASWEICIQVKKQQLESDMEQQTGSKLWKRYVNAVYCHPVYLTSMQSTSYWMLSWIKHKLGSRLQGEKLITSDMQMIPPLWQKVKRTKESLDEGERGEWKSWLKTHIQKIKIMASSPITSWKIDGETTETVTDFIFLGSKITENCDCCHEIKRCLLLGRKVTTNLAAYSKAETLL